jgi:O-antigen biosynthesis protein WbqP
MYQKYIKRIVDLLISLIALVLLSWLFLIIILLVRFTSKGPLFFCQKRIGLHKCEFSMIKFRTMRVHTPSDIPTHLLLNPEQYITPFGKFLRWSSLDELPQLINIIKGNMAIVGPRPALWNQYDLIEERDTYHANNLRPGLTGWAQVNGRDELTISEKARLDGEYTKNISFLFDIKCIIKTIGYIFRHDGIREGSSM